MAALLLSSSWSLQALAGQNGQGGNRSDAIILPPLQSWKPKWELKFVRPNLGDGQGGPPNIWKEDYGFLIQSTNPASYALNFPTTGADGLYFDLIIMQESDEFPWSPWEQAPYNDELIWAPVERGGITATVTKAIQNEGWILGSRYYWKFKNLPVIRVTLTGPEARAQFHNPNSHRITKPNLPQTFELVGRDREGNEVIKYGFVLQKWFVMMNHKYGPLDAGSFDTRYTMEQAVSWCNNLGGYRLSEAKDLTNAYRCNINQDGYCIYGVAPHTWYEPQRRIGETAGFYGEWGVVSVYKGLSYMHRSVLRDMGGLNGRYHDRYHFTVEDGGRFGIQYWYYSIANALCVTP